MNYQDYKNTIQIIENKLTELDKIIKSYPRNEIGLTPDNIKFSPEFKAIKAEFDLYFKELRKLNQFLTRNFKKEMREEIKNRYKKA